MDAANMLKPALVREDMRVIGATTAAEYERWIRGDPALERRFQPVIVRELSHEEALEVLRARRPRLEHHHAVAIADDALTAALVLTDKFVTDRAQPDKAIDVLDEACAHAQATAKLPPELERIVGERRRLDAAIRRRLARGEAPEGEREGEEARTPAGAGAEDPIDAFAREIGPTLERIGAEIERIFGNPARRDRLDERYGGRPDGAPSGPAGAGAAGTASGGGTVRPGETLLQRRQRLDRELRGGLEQLGVVVRGRDIARAVAAAVGKRIEWAE
jgi:ATP-dependent Clp protease ATP-binding subunit ClpA